MLAKIIVAADDRPAAIEKLRAALADTSIAGIETNLDYLRAIAGSDLLASRQGRDHSAADFRLRA